MLEIKKTSKIHSFDEFDKTSKKVQNLASQTPNVS